MSDPRFARLKTDPRFRRPKKQQSKVVVDERFSDVFKDKKGKKGKGRVDKYGREVSDNNDRDNLKKFYRLEKEEGDEAGPSEAGPDYARGEVLLESSDEDGEESDHSGPITLGLDHSKPISLALDDAEIDLDEGAFADLDAQAAAYASQLPEDQDTDAQVERTRRIAVVNLDWDHVRAVHLYKVFSSLVSSTAPSSKPVVHPDRERSMQNSSSVVVRGQVLHVRVYPSEFGKERMEKEEKEGPPVDVFKKRQQFENEDDIDEKNIYEFGGEDDYDEDALRTYQLERLRYYYAIVTCDTVEAASHIYSELEGTELERSANVFDLSFVPDDMKFDTEYRYEHTFKALTATLISVIRDEASSDPATQYKSVDFVTDALRHSRVKLTWDGDDPERTHLTRRTLTKKEIDEADFKAYIASSSSGSGSENELDKPKKKGKGEKTASRDKLRALLLGGDDDDELPEGWARGDADDRRDVDMEITFTPGLVESKDEKDETTLEKYERKMKEKRKKRKEKMTTEEKGQREDAAISDDFFDIGSGDEGEAEAVPRVREIHRKDKKRASMPTHEARPYQESTAEELALIAASDNPNAEPKHFDLKAIMKAEKSAKRKGKKDKKKRNDKEDEIQEDFSIDVKDDRFKALHEDHTFAIDPSNPQHRFPRFKKTKSMAALLQERATVQNAKDNRDDIGASRKTGQIERSLSSLVESVKRKSTITEQSGVGKRRKV
ncbi:hypothetical protein HWV62_23781 [Athelia sp. TMB]|nr:hypothetical protein HWV62_23781 [Athelia sp. TMB]